jgi:hypothetical protein
LSKAGKTHASSTNTANQNRNGCHLGSSEPPWRQLPSERKKALWDVLLYHVRDIQARMSYRDYYYTHIHNGHYEGLDHIMMSQEFVAQNPASIGRVSYVSLLNDHLVDATLSREGIPNWKSDHGQVVATIELRESIHLL